MTSGTRQVSIGKLAEALEPYDDDHIIELGFRNGRVIAGEDSMVILNVEYDTPVASMRATVQAAMDHPDAWFHAPVSLVASTSPTKYPLTELLLDVMLERPMCPRPWSDLRHSYPRPYLEYGF